MKKDTKRPTSKAAIRTLAQESLGLPVVPVENPQKVYHFRHRYDDDDVVADQGLELAGPVVVSMSESRGPARRAYGV